MNRALTFFLSFFPVTSISAQVHVRNVDLVEGAPNVLYRGFDNMVQIVGVDSADLKDLKTNNGKVYRSGPAWDLFRVSGTTGDTATLTVRTKGHGKSRTGFSVRKIHGEPHVSLGSLTDTIATIEEVLSAPLLHVQIPNCYLKEWYRVINYDLVLVSVGGSIMARFEGTVSNRLNKRQIEEIKLLQSGDQLCFTRIVAACPVCTLRSMGPMTIHIK